MRTKRPLFTGENEAVQAEIIFAMLGSPKDELLAFYRGLPDWEKLNVKTTHEGCKLMAKYQMLVSE